VESFRVIGSNGIWYVSTTNITNYLGFMALFTEIYGIFF